MLVLSETYEKGTNELHREAALNGQRDTGTNACVTRHCSSQKKGVIKKRDMHIYTGQGQNTVQLEPAQTRMRT